MRKTLLAAALVLSLGAAALDLPEAYQIIAQRNLFSPSRVAAPPPTAAAVVEPPPPPETITLIGAVVLEGQATALFVGSVPGLSGACRPGESLGALQIRAVSTAGVTLDADGQEGSLRLAVGESLRRLQGQPWQWAAVAVAPPAEAASALTTPAAPQAAAPTGGTGDVLKRLLERRKKEMNP